MCRILFISLLFFLNEQILFAQKQSNVSDSNSLNHTIVKPIRFKTLVFPASLILLGATGNSDGKGFILNKFEVREERDEYLPNFRSHIDNYLQYAPIAAVYGLDMMGKKGVNTPWRQTVILTESELLMNIAVLSLKHMTRQERPDNSDVHSFPSGHTAQAFLSAEFLRREYGQQHPWLAAGGYLAAAATGAMRVLNDKHWVSDVVAGAGIGILSVDLVYFMKQHKSGKHHYSSSLMMMPYYDGQGAAGVVCDYNFGSRRR